MKGLRVTKILKEIKFEAVWDEFESSKVFQRKSFTKYLRLTLVFMWGSALREKFNFCFSRAFLLVLAKLLFWGLFVITFVCGRKFDNSMGVRKQLLEPAKQPNFINLFSSLEFVPNDHFILVSDGIDKELPNKNSEFVIYKLRSQNKF